MKQFKDLVFKQERVGCNINTVARLKLSNGLTIAVGSKSEGYYCASLTGDNKDNYKMDERLNGCDSWFATSTIEEINEFMKRKQEF